MIIISLTKIGNQKLNIVKHDLDHEHEHKRYLSKLTSEKELESRGWATTHPVSDNSPPPLKPNTVTLNALSST